MIGQIRQSLTVKMFLVILALFLFISGATYGAVAYFMPLIYTDRLNENLREHARELVKQLEALDTLEEGEPLLKAFEKAENANVVILDSEDWTVYPVVKEQGDLGVDTSRPSAAQTTYVEEDAVTETAYVEADLPIQQVSEDSVVEQETAAEAYETGNPILEGSASDSGTETFSIEMDENRVYRAVVWGKLEAVNQAVEILVQVLPYIVILVLISSFLGAVFLSLYLVRPVVRMSRVAKKMAGLDFQVSCPIGRTDELGKLGESLNRLSGNLSQALTSLQKANDELKSDMEKEREQEKRRMAFFSAVSHELKTPVTILKGHLEGMLGQVGEYRNREYYLKRSLDVTHTMESMVQEILTVTRLETAGFEIHWELVDLAELLRVHLAEMTELMEEKELMLRVWIPEHCFWMADRSMISKVFGNLLMNAVRYSPQGATIRIFLREEQERLVCGVENTGVHIPEEALPKLFQAFYRVEESRNRRTGGSGLGLYLVQMILHQHQGGCLAENLPDGVRFSFAIPRRNSTETP